MSEVVDGTFLSSVFRVIFERLASTDFRDYVHVDVEKKLEITLVSINKVLDDAEAKQYHNQNVRNWLDDLKNEVDEVEKILDMIATDVQRKKIFESRIKVLLKRLKFIADQISYLGLQDATRASNEEGVTPQILPTISLVYESVIYGRELEKHEIIDYLLYGSDSGNQVPIIGIVGVIGIGKTTLAKLVYNDVLIMEHFELKSWVHVSESFDPVRLTQSILRSVHSSAADSEDLEILQHQLQQRLMGKKFLLVLDDVRNKNRNMWDHFLLPFSRGSFLGKVIMTTHDMEVASIMRSTQLLHLKQLKESDCWSLFVKHAFPGRNVFEYPNLELIGKKMVEKCGGLPLALKTLGNLLGRKFSEPDWVKILETDLWRLPEGDNNINPVLELSYLNLPSNLKHCFDYCSMFPKGYEFEKGEVIKLWMAEGLLNCRGRDKNEEELGNEFFNDLVSISFFQKSVIMPLCTGKYYFIMHDFVNDLAKSVSGESRLRIECDNVQEIPERTRHIWCSLDLKYGDRKLELIHKIKGLHSLIVEAQGYGDQRFKISTNVQHNLFSRLKYLQILSFSGCNLLELADDIINLKLLQYLDLSYTEIASLPSSICKLYNLQTLVLHDCFKLTELPLEFYKLNNLHHLNLEGTHIKKMPTKLERLNNLETLTDFVVGEQRGFDIKQLGKLNQLQGKLQISGLENVNDPAHAEAANLEDKEHLEELSMSYDE